MMQNQRESSSNVKHGSNSDISINYDYNKKSGHPHIHSSIISKPFLQVTDEVNASVNAQELSTAFDTQTNSFSSVYYDQPVHVYDMKIGADYNL